MARFGSSLSRVTSLNGSAGVASTATGPSAPLSTDSTLSNMTISAGTLSPSFASGTTAYTVSETNATSSVTVTPTSNESHATIQVRVNGGSYSAVTSGQASGSLSLNVGSNTIDVLVTAQDGSTTTTYTTTATRAAAWAVTKSFSWPSNANTVFVRADAVNAAQRIVNATVTFNCWVKCASLPQSVVAMKGDGYQGCASNGYVCNVSGKFRVQSSSTVDSTATAFDSTWHMVTMVISANNVTMYVDGTSGGTGTIIPGADCSSVPFQIGAYSNPGNATDGWTGSMCHLSIWNVALSGAEVSALRDGNGKPADLSQHSKFANCKTWYYLGDGDATGAGNVVDHSGNGYTATITGAITIASDAP